MTSMADHGISLGPAPPSDLNPFGMDLVRYSYRYSSSDGTSGTYSFLFCAFDDCDWTFFWIPLSEIIF